MPNQNKGQGSDDTEIAPGQIFSWEELDRYEFNKEDYEGQIISGKILLTVGDESREIGPVVVER